MSVQTLFLWFLVLLGVVQALLFINARRCEAKAVSTYWSVPTVATVQARYRLCQHTMFIFLVVGIVGSLIVFQ